MKSQPKLTLLIGPAGSGKTQVCTESFEEALARPYDDERLIPGLTDDLLFILPTAEHRARIIDLILRHGQAGFFHRRITTFDRALRELLKLDGINFATDVTRKIVLKEIFEQLEFQYFKDSRSAPGFLELVSRTIIEFKEYLIRPDELERRFAELKEQFPEFAFKYDDIVQIYQAYERELEQRGLIDLRDSLRLVEEGLDRGEFAAPCLRHVWIDGFSDFSKLQLTFIEFLTRHADEITITLTADQNPLRETLFEIPFETQSALEDLGFRTQWIGDKNYRAQNGTLKHLERNLFCHKPEILRLCEESTIQTFEAAGVSGEIAMIAREIKRLVRTQQYHFSDIAVLFRATDPYLGIIGSVFRAFEIPVEIHERYRLKHNPVARTLASFLGILLDDWNRKDLFNFLKSSYVTNGTTSKSAGFSLETPKTNLALLEVVPYEFICELELRALQKGIFKDRAYWLMSFPESDGFKEIARFEDIFLQLNSVKKFTAWAKAVMCRFGLLDFKDFVDEKTRLDREGAERILLLLEEMRQKERSSLPRNDVAFAFARELLALIDVDLYSVHSRDKNKVQIYNVSLARQKEYKAVFVAGLLEKQFPIQVKEDPILSDRERHALNEHGEVLKEKLPRQAFERYLFYLAVTRAREKLVLSYPRFDLEGKEMLPSFYVEEVRALFDAELPAKKQPVTEVLPPWEDVSSQEEAEERLILDLWNTPLPHFNRSEGFPPQRSANLPRSLAGNVESSTAFGIYNHFIKEPGFRRLAMRLTESIEGAIVDERIKPYFLPEKNMWSPTRVEEYAECPYRYFSNRILNLESQTEGIDIRRRGIILHDVLEDLFGWKQEKKRPVSFEDAVEHALRKFNELWQEEPLSGDRYYKIELERKKMQEMIIQIIRMELVEKKPPLPGLRPKYFEYDFRDLVLEGKRHKIVFRGKIDRIDVDPREEFALVIDYKTGKPFKPAALENGTSLQLPIYIIAVREKLGLKPLGGHLYSLKYAVSSGFHHKEHLAMTEVTTRKKNRFEAEEFEEILKRSVHFAEKFTEGIERAEIPVRPRDCVKYCPYSSVCRIEKRRLEHIYREIALEDQEQSKRGQAPFGKVV